MYSLSRSTLNYVLTAQIYTRTVYLLSTYTLKLLSFSITSNETKNRQSFAPSPPPPSLPSPLPLSFLFFNYYDIFGWISALYRRGNPSVAVHDVRGPVTAKGHSAKACAVARGARPLTPWRRALRMGHARGPLPAAPGAVAHDVMSLTPWATTPDVYFC
jgi:hypothetical protein